jgi:hypothetical protein
MGLEHLSLAIAGARRDLTGRKFPLEAKKRAGFSVQWAA